MRIGVDACCWSNGRGYGRYTRELLRAMVSVAPEEEWLCFIDERAAQQFDLRAPSLRLVRVKQRHEPTRAAAADRYRSPGDMVRLTHSVWRQRPDVFFSPSAYTYFPLPPGLPAVVAIHDTIPERFPELTLPSRRARLFWRAKVRLALAQANLVMTVSAYSARELQRVFGVPADRIRVVPPAPAAAYRPGSSPAEIRAVARRLGLSEQDRWFTYVGGFNPHKRVDRLVRAHATIARDGGRPPHLLLVGGFDDVFHDNVAEIRSAIDAAGTGDLVHWTGFLPDEDLRVLHVGALGLVLISEAEGFGLPAIEAAACATPVIATVESPLPELLTGGGIFVRPADERALVDALRVLRDDEEQRRTMGLRALDGARRLSWDSAGRAAIVALQEAVRAPAPPTSRGAGERDIQPVGAV